MLSVSSRDWSPEHIATTVKKVAEHVWKTSLALDMVDVQSTGLWLDGWIRVLCSTPRRNWLMVSSITSARRQELPLNGGNGNPMSGYEANDRCARPIFMIMHDACDATGRASSRSHVDLCTAQSAAPDDLRSRSRTAAVHSSQCLHASISMLISRCLLCLKCVLACASTASMFASNQTACQRKKTSPDENLCSSPVKPTTTPPHSPCSSISKLLVDHKCFFCQALRSRRSWWRRDLFQ